MFIKQYVNDFICVFLVWFIRFFYVYEQFDKGNSVYLLVSIFGIQWDQEVVFYKRTYVFLFQILQYWLNGGFGNWNYIIVQFQVFRGEYGVFRWFYRGLRGVQFVVGQFFRRGESCLRYRRQAIVCCIRDFSFVDIRRQRVGKLGWVEDYIFVFYRLFMGRRYLGFKGRVRRAILFVMNFCFLFGVVQFYFRKVLLLY